MNRWMTSLLILLVGVLMAIPAWLNSYVYNENGRLASGVIYLKTGDYTSFHVNPPLVNLIGAIPATLAGTNHATRADLGISSFGRDEYKAGKQFIKDNKNHRTLLFLGRLCCIALVLAGFMGTFRFARTFSGLSTGYVFLGLCLFSPFFLGFGPLVVPDVAAALFGAISVYFFWRWLCSPDMGNAFIAGLTLGLAELCKFTLLVFYPLFVLLWVMYRFPKIGIKSQVSLRRQFLQLILTFAVSLLIINMGYLFEGTGKPLRSFKFQTTLFTGVEMLKEVPAGGGNRFDGSGNIVETALGYLPMPLPKNFIQGIDTQRYDFERGLPSYLRGEWSEHGWWYYYLYALLIKTPLGTLLLFLLAIFCTLFLEGYNNNWRDEMVVFLPGIVLLVFVSSQSGFSVHSRYIIPALPFFFIWMSKVGRAFTLEIRAFTPKSSRCVRWLTIVFLAWSVGSSLWVYPHSIAYFNELAAILPTPEDKNYPQPEEQPMAACQKVRRLLNAGPLNGPRHLLDSNIDWGQDLFELERWCKNHPEVKQIYVTSAGSYPVELTTIPSTGMPPANTPQPDWYALSVNYLYNKEKQFQYFLNFQPVTIIGYTIYVYHITEADIDRKR